MKRGEGFSFVRLGDSEGALLLYNPKTAKKADYEYIWTMFGRDISQNMLVQMADQLRAALSAADLIGNRDDVWLARPSAYQVKLDDPDFTDRFRGSLKLREVERSLDDHAVWRLFGLHQWSIDSIPVGRPVCSSWIPYDLALRHFWERLIVYAKSVTLIHCSPSLPDQLRQVLGVQVEHIRIPDMAAHRDRWPDDDGAESIYPDSYNRVQRTIDVPQHGRLVLIGAGIPGKAYAATIKRQGGIALDLGGLLDAWDGRATRPLVFATKTPTQAPSRGHEPYMLQKPSHFPHWMSHFALGL
ncbi:hypothetical protein [Mesorhizobium sp. M1B.F.Ca.ET.045.04.1.1]|uniref:hypothetical protein n=1 Tax=Mesorhizobium sp. M1B.F.Ca.ET.045.04.1.1 TaxID=2493673 RepID=UPI000F75A1CB|nr:hypothetical protein [Mesorhizobium sp. M1B.F.Ca.ET.045.04.1.1]AZO32318.1 hypothetical protein EJ071_36525 [Mesorhizobium sp. M1B.F.Ca.ET.045.04.1.1]